MFPVSGGVWNKICWPGTRIYIRYNVFSRLLSAFYLLGMFHQFQQVLNINEVIVTHKEEEVNNNVTAHWGICSLANQGFYYLVECLSKVANY
jgi:hypothetical protein